MPCYHPIEMFDNTFYSRDPDELDVSFKPTYAVPRIMERQGRRLLLPCRHCVGCRLDKSREWANRILMEQQYHQESWFLTLTYDDEHLPPAFPVDPATGEILSIHATLVKSDLQKFFKRLRYFGQKVSYYSCGEYGSQTYRPHYHCIIFGLHLTDLKPLKKNFSGSQYFTSEFISKCWPFGIHVLGSVTFQSSAYVARYTMKKATHGISKDYYDKAGIEPEFQTISSRPAIGRRFYDDHKDMFKYDTFYIATPDGGIRATMPEYFRKLQRKDDPKSHVRHAHQCFVNAEIKRHLKLSLTDMSYCDILSVEEEKRLSRISALTRDDI